MSCAREKDWCIEERFGRYGFCRSFGGTVALVSIFAASLRSILFAMMAIRNDDRRPVFSPSRFIALCGACLMANGGGDGDGGGGVNVRPFALFYPQENQRKKSAILTGKHGPIMTSLFHI